MTRRGSFSIGSHTIEPGCRKTVELPVSVLSDHTPVTVSVHVVHGRRPGPTLFVSAAVHGDEVIGVEICRRLLRMDQLESIRGTLLVVPIVNSFGFLNHSRYLPDRRDLNRSFPGQAHGSLASKLAHIFMREIVARSDFGIDLHSAAIHRTNMPQIRFSSPSDETARLAAAFAPPIIIRAKLREGSLRWAAQNIGVDVLLFEAGEALRFDEMSGRSGVSGILRVMHAMGMTGAKGTSATKVKVVHATSSSWLRASAGGMLRAFRTTGEMVEEGAVLGMISDPFGEIELEVISTTAGVIVGRTNMPVVNEGDALFHIAETDMSNPEATIESHAARLEADPMFDEDEII